MDVHMQSCPITTATQSTNDISAIKCIDASQNGYYVLNECDIVTSTPPYRTTIDNTPYDMTIVRRRQLISTQISDYLLSTCISYDIIGLIPDCMQQINFIFLPLCSNTNTSQLTESHITQIILHETFATGNNIKRALGVNINGNLGILVELISMRDFKICIGNIIINQHNLNAIDINTVDISDGIMVGNSINNERFHCNIDGLPCFNFFFQQECVVHSTNTSDTDTTHMIGNLFGSMGNSYHLLIHLSFGTWVIVWCAVVFVIGVLILNIIFYHYCTTKSMPAANDCETDDDEESEISDIEAA